MLLCLPGCFARERLSDASGHKGFGCRGLGFRVSGVGVEGQPELQGRSYRGVSQKYGPIWSFLLEPGALYVGYPKRDKTLDEIPHGGFGGPGIKGLKEGPLSRTLEVIWG